jgi:hypothetical protein
MRREDTLDGRTFEPWRGGTAEARTPRPVFSARDRERLAGDPHLRPYLTITQDQVAGLLCALDRYAMILPAILADEPSFCVMDAETLQACRTLADVCRDLMRHPEATAPPPASDAVFDAPEQHELSYRKNVRGFEHITREDLVRLLRALDQYAVRAPQMDVFRDSWVPAARFLHAHNVAVSFRERPLTLNEYSEEVRGVIAKAHSLESRRQN